MWRKAEETAPIDTNGQVESILKRLRRRCQKMPFHSSLKICRCLLFNLRQIILGGQRSDLETMGGREGVNSLLTESADKCSAG